MAKHIAVFAAPGGADRAHFLASVKPDPVLETLILHLADHDAPYDMIAEIWGEDGAALSWLEKQKPLCAYRVDEALEKYVPHQPGQPPRRALFSFIQARPELTAAEYRRHWDEHVPIARRVHLAATQYARNFVMAALPRGAPPCTGIAYLSFANETDRAERLFETPRGKQEVIDDTAEFVGARIVIHSTEHVIQGRKL